MARRSLARRLLVAGAVVWVARWVVAAGRDEAGAGRAYPTTFRRRRSRRAAPRRAFRKRLATSLVFSTLFFAGAAFTAGAGNELAHVDAASTDPAAVLPLRPVASATDTDASTDATPAVTADAGARPTSDAAAPVAGRPVAAPPMPATRVVVQSSDAASSRRRRGSHVSTAQPRRPAGTQAQCAVATRPRMPAASVAARSHAARAVVAPLAPIPFAGDRVQSAGVAARQPGVADGRVRRRDRAALPRRAVRLGRRDSGDRLRLLRAHALRLRAARREPPALRGLRSSPTFPKLDPSELQPGDLVFFEPKFDGPGHVAIYIGNDQMIEAPHTGALVRISSFSERGCARWASSARCARTPSSTRADPAGDADPGDRVARRVAPFFWPAALRDASEPAGPVAWVGLDAVARTPLPDGCSSCGLRPRRGLQRNEEQAARGRRREPSRPVGNDVALPSRDLRTIRVRRRLTATVVPVRGATHVERARAPSKPAVDCFYVYPTISDESTINANLAIGFRQRLGRARAGVAVLAGLPRLRSGLPADHAERARPSGADHRSLTRGSPTTACARASATTWLTTTTVAASCSSGTRRVRRS